MATEIKYIRLFASDLRGIALDWAMGCVLGYKLKLLKIGDGINEAAFNKPCICRYISGDSLDKDVIKLPRLIPFRPTEDWELLPDDYRSSYDYVEYSTIETRSSDGIKTHDTWMAVKELHEDGEPTEYDFHEGNTKLEAICKAYVADKMRIIDIPEEVINCM